MRLHIMRHILVEDQQPAHRQVYQAIGQLYPHVTRGDLNTCPASRLVFAYECSGLQSCQRHTKSGFLDESAPVAVATLVAGLLSQGCQLGVNIEVQCGRDQTTGGSLLAAAGLPQRSITMRW